MSLEAEQPSQAVATPDAFNSRPSHLRRSGIGERAAAISISIATMLAQGGAPVNAGRIEPTSSRDQIVYDSGILMTAGADPIACPPLTAEETGLIPTTAPASPYPTASNFPIPSASPEPSPSAPAPLEPGTSFKPNTSPDPVLCGPDGLPLPTPSASPYPTGSNVPIPTASPEAGKSAEPNKPAPDSYKTVLKTKIDKEAKIGQVDSIIDGLYADRKDKDLDGKYKAALGHLTDPWGDRANQRNIKSGLSDCAAETEKSAIAIRCSGNITNLLWFAQEYSLDSGDPIDVIINQAFVKAAKTLRSVAVNKGALVKALDGLITHTAQSRGLK